MVSTKGNKYVYIKPDFLAESQSTSHSPTAKGSSKILVNPNFKASVFLNPHFNKSNAQSQKMKIHINPHILKNDYRGLTMKSNMTYVKKGMSEEIFTSDNNVLMDIPERVTTTKLARVEPQKSNSSEPYITKHKYKLVRQNVKTKQANTKKISLNSNKSLVNRNVVNHKRKLVQVQSCIHPQMYITRSKFKLVKRQIHHKQTFKWCRIKNTSTPVNKISEDIIVKKKPRKLTRYVWLNSTLHRRSADVLRNNHIFDKKALKQHNSVSQPGVRKLIYTHGVKYMVGRNQKVLRLLPSGEKHTTKKILRRSRVEKKSVKLARFPRTKKCNVPCMFYRKYGRCRQHERGMCSKVHDPNQIIVCPRFLQGACINKTCLLSHDLSPEKMPTCKFFLEGLCSKETCPYPHVKVNPKADICQEFLRGFCKKGRECDNRHQYLCPAFEKHGKCSNKKCYYPHGNEIKKGAIMALSLSCRKSERQQNNDSKVAKLPVTNNMEQSEEKKGPRYYMDLGLEQIKDCENPMAVAQERQKIGDLPCFIPFPM